MTFRCQLWQKRSLNKLIFLILLLLTSCATKEKQKLNTLNTFTTDGCTAYPDGKWLHCCLAHDMNYWLGGTISEKRASDDELKACVSKASSSFNGTVVSSGVRFGGFANNIFPWAWGYGWKSNRGYRGIRSSEEVSSRVQTILKGLTPYRQSLNLNQMIYVLSSYEMMKLRFSKERGVGK